MRFLLLPPLGSELPARAEKGKLQGFDILTGDRGGNGCSFSFSAALLLPNDDCCPLCWNYSFYSPERYSFVVLPSIVWRRHLSRAAPCRKGKRLTIDEGMERTLFGLEGAELDLYT
ncbi:hypothetical protein TNCV_2479341 [Trichonephila clavipes]|nr:hypothetical protein TNCV_2479341 [Trichonephila clavipes]